MTQVRGPRVAPSDSVAIVGMSCRFPGARGLEAFWSLLANGVDAVTEVPTARWNNDDYYDPKPNTPGKMNTRWGGFIDRIDEFDPAFFGIAPREAQQMDPQQRLLLELVYAALEDGGHVLDALAGGKVGVYIGISGSEYGLGLRRNPDHIDAYTMTGNALSIAANRVSYVFDFRGPSMAVDTACSSSIVAVHHAVESLLRHESNLVIAGACNLTLAPESSVAVSRLQATSPDGRCKAFDARANGYVRGEGVGVLILKRLSDALRDGDRIDAVIRGTNVNQDGRGNGLTAPNGHAQQALLREALAAAGLDAGRVSYVDAHGTGTYLGDPIEANALGEVLGKGRPKDDPLRIGSVKTNIGHLEAAAGIASVIKVALAMRHRQLPPSLHFGAPNPLIEFERLNLRVQTKLEPWKPNDESVCAGVSSFGIGGTNAHLVLESFANPPLLSGAKRVTGLPGALGEVPPGRPVILPLSARSEESLRSLCAAYARRLEGDAALEGEGLAALAASVATRRTAHDERCALVARNRETLLEQLKAASSGEQYPGLVRGRRTTAATPAITFVFSGQGSQSVGMGRVLLSTEPVFRDAIERFDRAFVAVSGWSVRELLLATNQGTRLEDTANAQPAILAVQIALTELWASWGITPRSVIGHSVGEIAAAWAAGAISIEEAALIVHHRSRLMQTAASGRMVSVWLPASEVQERLASGASGISVAAINSPGSCVVSGPEEEIDSFAVDLRAEGILCRQVKVRYAFHSAMMDGIAEQVRDALVDLAPRVPQRAFFSTVTGAPVTEPSFGAEYWRANVRKSVRFADAVHAALEDETAIFVEIGAHPVLLADVEACQSTRAKKAKTLFSLRSSTDDATTLATNLASLFAQGVQPWWASYSGRIEGAQPSLPAYEWNRQKLWLDPGDLPTVVDEGPASKRAVRTRVPTRLLGVRLDLATRGRIYEVPLSVLAFPYVGDHCIYGRIVVPAVVFLAMAFSAIEELFGSASAASLEEVLIREAFILDPEEERKVQVHLVPEEDGSHRFEVFSKPEQSSDWQLHVTAVVRPVPKGELDTAKPAAVDASGLVSSDSLYALHREQGFQLGPTFQGIRGIRQKSGAAVGRIEPQVDRGKEHVHPTFLDACLQVLGAAMDSTSAAPHNASSSVYIPLTIDYVRALGNVEGPWLSHANVRKIDDGGEGFTGDIEAVHADSGAPMLSVRGLRTRRASQEALHRMFARQSRKLRVLVPTWTVATEDDTSAFEAPPMSTRGLELLEFPDRVTFFKAALDRARDKVKAGPIRLLTRPGSPEQDAVSAMARVFASEHPNLWAGRIEAADREHADVALRKEPQERADEVRYDAGVRQALRLVEHKFPPNLLVARDLFAGKTFLVTGGLGGLGLELAGWLVDHGATKLVLVGRSEATAAVRQRVGALEAEIRMVRCDVADADAIQRVVSEIPALDGVFHAAGLVRDRFFINAGWDDFEAVWKPKADGALNLHRATQGLALDHFVLFSSFAASLGSFGQSTYAAANGFLDGLATQRRAKGLAALSVQWGPWAEVGIAARMEETHRERLIRSGLRPMDPRSALEALGRLMVDRNTPATAAVVDLELAAFRAEWPSANLPALLRGLPIETAPATGASAASGGREEVSAEGHALREKLEKTAPNERRALLESELGRQICLILGTDPKEGVDPARGFFDLGMDSLMAVELRTKIVTNFWITSRLPATLAFDYPNVGALAGFMEAQLFPPPDAKAAAGSPQASAPAKATPVKAAPAQAAPGELEALDEAALLKLLEEEMA